MHRIVHAHIGRRWLLWIPNDEIAQRGRIGIGGSEAKYQEIMNFYLGSENANAGELIGPNRKKTYGRSYRSTETTMLDNTREHCRRSNHWRSTPMRYKAISLVTAEAVCTAP
nr:hypothetical protein CFP56_55026 [Quercus suber]